MTLASSAPVTTAITPGDFFAAAAAIDLMRAWACGERTKATCAMRGSVTSLHILSAALREPLQIRPRHRTADIGIGSVERGQDRRGVVGDFHHCTLLLSVRPRESGDPGTRTMSFFVYILASRRNGTLYIGMTDNLVGRVWQHQAGLVSGFTKTYGVQNSRLVRGPRNARICNSSRTATQEMESCLETRID